jgi:hypothetical protein
MKVYVFGVVALVNTIVWSAFFPLALSTVDSTFQSAVADFDCLIFEHLTLLQAFD